MSSSPHPIDVHVGARIRLRRRLLGMSQSKLARLLGVSFQQIQKYEKGHNRIGSSSLFRLACLLAVPVEFFFADLPMELRGQPGTGTPDAAPELLDAAVLDRRETLELVRAFHRISDARVRLKLLHLVKAMARSTEV